MNNNAFQCKFERQWQKNRIRVNAIELKRIGDARWWPIITTDAWAKLCNHEMASVGKYVYMPNIRISSARLVYFGVSICGDLSSRKVEKLGTFLIDVEKKTIKRTTGNHQAQEAF